MSSAEPVAPHGHTQVVYTDLNLAVFDLVPAEARRILDLGCGAGALGGHLKARYSCEVVGVTYSEEEAVVARAALDSVVVADLNAFTPDEKTLGTFDCIICSHVLEHLFDPTAVLRRVRPILKPTGTLVIALPNVMNLKQRVEFMKGRFRYTDWGLMDRTHFRFFDWDTAYEMVRDAGYEVTHRSATGRFPLPGLRRLLRDQGTAGIDRVAARWRPNLFGLQFLLAARPTSEKGR